MQHGTNSPLRIELNTVLEGQALSISRQGRLLIANLERGTQGPGTALKETMYAAQDLASYFDGTQPTPESNRNGIPHARDWDTGHAMHLVRDLEFALDEARQDIPDSLYASAVRGLLELTVKIAVTSSYEETKPFLDRMVRGELPDQPGTPVFETEKGIGKSDP